MSTDEYEVEKIIGKRVYAGINYYHVKWAGFPESEATWEPANNLNDCKELIKEYNRHSFTDATKSTQISKVVDFTSARKTEKGIVFSAIKRNGEVIEMSLQEARTKYASKLVDFLLQYVK